MFNVEDVRKHNFERSTSSSKNSFPKTTPRRLTTRPFFIFFYLKTFDIALFHWMVNTGRINSLKINLISIFFFHAKRTLFKSQTHALHVYIASSRTLSMRAKLKTIPDILSLHLQRCLGYQWSCHPSSRWQKFNFYLIYPIRSFSL